jgi:hypothetical protein
MALSTSMVPHHSVSCFNRLLQDPKPEVAINYLIVLSIGVVAGVSELVERMDQFDWTEGIIIRQSRANASQGCATRTLGECYHELGRGDGSTASFGYNWTDPEAEPRHPFVYHTVSELGSNPNGLLSASIPSMRTYDSSGFVAVVIPFFSNIYLQPESGESDQVTDFRDTYVNATNGRTAKYYCVRLSPNGRHIKQLCDPGSNGDGTGAMTGVVRAAVEELWNDLKRGHFIDSRTRVVTLTLQLKSNAVGVAYRISLMFELATLGTVLTSYDVETRIFDEQMQSEMFTFADAALAMVIFFMALEATELLSGGVASYFASECSFISNSSSHAP